MRLFLIAAALLAAPVLAQEFDPMADSDRLISKEVRGDKWICTYTRGIVLVLPLYQQCPLEIPR